RRQLGIALLSSSTPQVPFFMGRLRQRTGITPPSSLAMTGISSTEPLLRPFVIARPVGFRPRRSPDVIEAPAAGGDCFTQGKHIPSSFFHGTREAAYRNYSPSSLAMTGISGMELTLRLSVIARLAGFQPKRSPDIDRGIGDRWRLLRSGAAQPSSFFLWDP